MAANSLSIQDISNSISKKQILITKSELLNLGKDINLVGYNQIYLNSNLNKTFSPELLNWVESYNINGINKTLFYTKVNTGLEIGDRVFIINGNYDSDSLITIDKYKKGRDGYKVLYVDKCKIVLDIDYTGVLPYIDQEDDEFIKIYHIKDDKEFLHANRQTTTRSGSFDYKFNPYQNNIAFFDSNYNAINTKYWGYNGGVTGSPGFYVKNGTQSWTNITSQFNSGSYSIALSPTYINNNRIKIMNGSFTYNGKEFKEGYIYKWNNEWIVDVTYFIPIISKNNFRGGNFKGIWNVGLFGKQDDQINWEGETSTWNSGTLLNARWLKGIFNSNHTLPESYFASFDTNGLPYQKINDVNNAGRGYNFIINSTIINSTILNGSIYNTIIGTSSTYSVVENEILNSITTYNNNIQGFFDTCQFNNTYINKSELKNTRSSNSKIENSKSINSYFDDSVFKYSNYNSDNIIKILAYDELNASEYKQNGTFSYTIAQKVYKFYINKDSYKRLKTSDKFYIKGLKINDNSKNLISFFDKKFQINSWTNYDDEINPISKNGYEYSAFLSTPGDNLYNFTSVISTNYYTSTYNNTNPNNIYYSIDIWVRINYTGFTQSINFNRELTACPNTNIVEPNSLGNIIDITNAYIIDSDFNSGLFDSSDWNSGYHFNENNDTNISTTQSFNYKLSINTNNYVIATTSYNLNEPENIKPGNVVFLDSVDFISQTGSVIRLPDAYKATYNNGIFTLKEIGGNITSGLSMSIGTYSTINAYNRYGHIKLLKINNSNIKSGIFRRPHITQSLIKDINYDSLDKDYINIDKIKNLLIVDSIFSNKLNTLSSATYLYSFFLGGNDTWDNGIIQNSIWNGGTFSSGIIKESRWINGNFTGGYFYNSRTFDNNGTNSTAENISTYYKDGGTHSNDRYSWQNGNFINGDFYKSDWENGTFSYGNFYLSKWYDGNFVNGVIGNNQISVSDTKFYNGTISYATVDNATIYAENNNNNIYWLDGIFVNGVFGAAYGLTTSATWYNGIFNGGQFIDNSKWKNGTFNGGKFLSSYGYTYSDSIAQSYFGWENGTFNNGEFGNANGSTNSIWYTGQFNNGIFKGRLWNNGVFLYGEFQGSGTNPVGGTYGTTYSHASQFVDSFTDSYWGKWRNGIFTDTKDKFIQDQKLFTIPTKANRPPQSNKSGKFKNGLWENGTFSHPNGEMYSSVWLDGIFEKGKFNNSSFNPYVRRGLTYSFNLNDSTCYWQNGELNESDFFISNWHNGKFIMGTAVGAVWKNGIVEYMNAFNIFWENGLWRNGNWYGSSFEFDGIINDDYTYQIIRRGMSWSGTSSCHIWNIFQGNESIIDTYTASNSTPV